MRDDRKLSQGLVLRGSGYTLMHDDQPGSRIDIPDRDGLGDLAALRSELRKLKSALAVRRDLDVFTEAGVSYGELVTALDLALDEGFSELVLSPGARTDRRD